MSTLLRPVFTLTLVGATIGLWLPSEAQDIEGPRPHTTAPQEPNDMALAVDDPYGAPPGVVSGTQPNADAVEPVTPDRPPSDSSTSNHEVPAESVIPPAPVAPLAPDLMRFEKDATSAPSFETMETRREQAEAQSELADVPNLLPPPETLPALSIIPVFRLGPMTASFGLRYRALYDNNILLTEHDKQGDFEHILSPRFSLRLGSARSKDANPADVRPADGTTEKPNFLALDYDPQLIFFQRYGQYNAFQQELSLTAQYVLSRTVLRESFDYTHGSDPDREVQGRTSRDVISNDTYATYRASERFSFELGGTALVRNFEQGINSDEGRVRFWTRYRASPSWTASVGAVGGALLPEEGSTQIFQQIWLATQNQIGPDLNVYLGIGGDFREPDSTGEILTTPVFSAIIRYEPSTETQLELLAIRQIFSSSDSIDQNFISTRISLKATQRLWQTYHVGLEVGYENADYYQFGTQTAPPRSDNYPTAKLEFNYARFKDLQAGLFYLVRRNFSSEPNGSFSNQQVGAQVQIGY